MWKVNILLSTYNGEKYLEEQLDSLLNQTYQNIDIYIRDDGSHDGTWDIIKKYKEEHARKIFLIESTGNLGYPDCFWHMLQECKKADAYAFCDQDDIWELQKIEYAVAQMQKRNTKSPLLYIHEYDNCDKHMRLLSHHSIGDISSYQGYQLIFYTIAQGFSMVINNEMRYLILNQKPLGKDLPHDGWLIWNAFYGGDILYDSRILAKYRRHDNTETSSGSHYVQMLKSWWKKEVLGDEMTKQAKRIDYFLRVCSCCMDGRELAIWKTFGNQSRSLVSYFQKLFFPKRLRKFCAGEAALRFLFLIGK